MPKFLSENLFAENVYKGMKKATNGAYRGGSWEFYRLSNGGFYMGLTGSAKYRMTHRGMSFYLSEDASSIAINLSFLLIKRSKSKSFAKAFRSLKDYALMHDEKEGINGFIEAGGAA